MSDGEGVLILCGPTASGKSALALELAAVFDAEIVNADSRQIYRGMPIGTAAPSEEERRRIPHHLYGFLDPHERYSAARYAEDAMRVIGEIRARGKRAIVVGGTGFYIRTLSGAVDLAPQYDPELRERLRREAEIHDAEFLHGWLALHDPRRAAMLHVGDRYRVLRALEIVLARRPPMRTAPLPTLASAGIPFVKVALDLANDELDRRIEARVEAMLEAGFVEEAERIGADAVAANAVGYPQALAYLRGWCTTRELRAVLIRATRRYARRQRTWLRSEPGVIFLAREAVAALARERLAWS